MINFHNCDNMKFMAEVSDKYYDLAIVDPPYGIGQPNQSNLKGYNGRESLNDRMEKNRLNNGSGKLKNRVLNNSKINWDNEIPSDEYFSELKRISKNQIIWGGNYFPLPPSRCIICWDKVQPWENFSQVELAWTSFDSPAQLFRFDNRTGGKIHPTQKPVALYEWLLSKYAKPNDKIIDTHGGSGSIAIAVDKANTLDNTNYSLDIIELDKDYFDASVNRFNKYKSQQTIQFK
jgi:site-specific DNA-methyltransferase (adenine-specific)